MKSREAIAAINALHRYQSLATSVPSRNEGCLAWVCVYPLDLNREATREFLRNQGQAIPLPIVHTYHLRRFEVARALIEQDASIGEPDLQGKLNYFAYGDDDLLLKLDRLGVRLEDLAMPYKSNYPI